MPNLQPVISNKAGDIWGLGPFMQSWSRRADALNQPLDSKHAIRVSPEPQRHTRHTEEDLRGFTSVQPTSDLKLRSANQRHFHAVCANKSDTYLGLLIPFILFFLENYHSVFNINQHSSHLYA